MKLVVAFLIVCGAMCALGQQYTTKYDNINVDEVLSNSRIRSNYVKCLLETGSCTAEGRELKRLLPEALQTNCSKCTPVQTKNLVKTIKHFENSDAKDWKRLQAKFDPKGTYITAFKNTHQ